MRELIAKQYPEDALLGNQNIDAVKPSDVATLDGLFRERVRRSANVAAYGQYDEKKQQWITLNWGQVAFEVERWQCALSNLNLGKGDRVAICHKNSIEWVVFDQAALSLGLVVVPLYISDRADNIAYVLNHSGAKLALFSNIELCREIEQSDENIDSLETVLLIGQVSKEQVEQLDKEPTSKKRQYIYTKEWLPEVVEPLHRGVTQTNDLASIIYTSGTTGKPKGVMLSHDNMLSNAYSGLRSIAIEPTTVSLSFLPLSHTLERTVGLYGTMMVGSQVFFNRSIDQLADDLLEVKPTMIVSVPRIFERVHNAIYQSLEGASGLKKFLFRSAIEIGWYRFQVEQGRKRWHPKLLCLGLLDKLVGQKVRDKLGGRLSQALVGGAPMSFEVSKTFLALGVHVLQGYGLTETSPIVSVNTLKQNLPGSIGLPVRGVEVKLIENEELCVRGSNVMQGYWDNEQATKETMVEDWLKTGDRASINEQGFLHIIGRIKEIIVMANGEKVPPRDIEAAISEDPLFEQVMLLGEGKSFLSVLLVLNVPLWQQFKQQHNLEDNQINSEQSVAHLLERVSAQMSDFPGYAKIRRLHASLEEWTVENGLLTPTLKLKRPKVMKYYQKEIDELYQGHGVRKH